MNDNIVDHLYEMGYKLQKGYYGKGAQSEYEEVITYKNNQKFYLEFIKQYYNPKPNEYPLYILCQKVAEYLLGIYRDTKIANPKVATAYYFSITDDYPGTKKTALLPLVKSLTELGIASKDSIAANNYQLAWNTYKSLFASYNEFLNALLGYVIIMVQAVSNEEVKPEILSWAYNDKVNKFKKMKLDLLFPVLDNFIERELRNAIVHSNIIHKMDENLIEYTTKGNQTKQISEVEFIAKAGAGSYLATGYLMSLYAIDIIENGNQASFNMLPKQIIELFKNDYVPKN